MKFGLEFIKKLKPCTWKYKPGPLAKLLNTTSISDKEHVGLVAQDVNEVVDQNKYAFVVMKNGFYAINYYEFIGPLIKAVQELEEKVAKFEIISKECECEERKGNYPK